MAGWGLALGALPGPIPFQDNEGVHGPGEQEERLIELYSLHCPPGHRLRLQRREEVGEPEGRKRLRGFLRETQVLLPQASTADRSGPSLWRLPETGRLETCLGSSPSSSLRPQVCQDTLTPSHCPLSLQGSIAPHAPCALEPRSPVVPGEWGAAMPAAWPLPFPSHSAPAAAANPLVPAT